VDEDQAPDPEGLPPPAGYRPWTGVGADQPGASRPRRYLNPRPPLGLRPDGDVLPTRGPAPGPGHPSGASYPPGGRVEQRPDPYASQYPTRVAPPTVRSGRREGTGRGYAVGLAVALAATAWFPWVKLTTLGVFEVVGTRANFTVDAWGMPASALWSRTPSPGGVELGYLVLAVAGLILAAGFVIAPRALVRSVGAVATLIPTLFLLQVARSIHDAATLPGVPDRSVTDVSGLGVYLLLVVGLVALLAPPGRSA